MTQETTARELRVGDVVKDNDWRMALRPAMKVVGFDGDRARLLGPTGRVAMVSLSRIYLDGLPRKSGWSVVQRAGLWMVRPPDHDAVPGDLGGANAQVGRGLGGGDAMSGEDKTTAKKGTRMWGVVTARGKVVNVARTKEEAAIGFLYSLEALGNRLARVVVTVAEDDR